jgi:hypothetical protein
MRAALEGSDNDDLSILDLVAPSAAYRTAFRYPKNPLFRQSPSLAKLVVTSGALFKFSFDIFVREHPAETPGNVL